MSELSPIIEILQSENTCAVIVGDFNINLLQIFECDKFSEVFDLMFNFFPKLHFPPDFQAFMQSHLSDILQNCT